jgi:hypothetical protein
LNCTSKGFSCNFLDRPLPSVGSWWSQWGSCGS